MLKRNLKWSGVVLLVIVLSLAVLLTACQGSAGPAGASTCSECHNETTLVYSKSIQSATTTHMTGGAYGRGTSASCAGCHASEGFTAMVAAGLTPDTVEEGVTNPSPQNCRTCHQIHTTYTEADFALKTTAPLTLYASGEPFDMGDGNLCATCHQPRRLGPQVGGGDYEITSTHWGPHHGPQSTVLLGVSAYGVPDSTGTHYQVVSDGCPVCHMADGNHTLAASTAGCQSCHAELDTLDLNGVQTEIKALFDELEDLLLAKGLLATEVDEETGEVEIHPNPGIYTEAQAGAAWNWMIVYEDNSWGVHNPAWTKAILEQGIELVK